MRREPGSGYEKAARYLGRLHKSRLAGRSGNFGWLLGRDIGQQVDSWLDGGPDCFLLASAKARPDANAGNPNHGKYHVQAGETSEALKATLDVA